MRKNKNNAADTPNADPASQNVPQAAATNTVYSVTKRVRSVKQPKGGYIDPEIFEKDCMGAGLEELNDEENISPSLMHSTLTDLTRVMLGESVENAFEIPLFGAEMIKDKRSAHKLMRKISGLEDESIINAVKLCGYEIVYRSGACIFTPTDQINPDKGTVENIRIMVKRCQNFFKKYGPLVVGAYNFEGGYTDEIQEGDGDFVTADTIWDFKASKKPLTKAHTLEMLIYWRMGLHSEYPQLKPIKNIGIFNPRLNIAYKLSTDKIPAEVIETVDRDVIGYKE